MKKSKKITCAVLALATLLTTSVFATTINSEKATMEIVENKTCTINITDESVFEKKLTNYDLDKKELTINLKVSNNAVLPLDKPSEIILVIDNSKSMQETISTGGTRMEAIADSAKTLATELLKLDTVKIGVVSFSTVGENADGSNIDEGTLADAKLRTDLTTSKDTIMNAITEIANDATGVRTDIEAGVTLASQYFTGTCESQFIILLTDGVPNISLGSNKIQYSGATATNTKKALTTLSSKGIEILSMMTGVSDDLETQTGNTYKELAEEIFGTPTKPTVGKFYYITDGEIEETISNVILNQLIAPKDDILTNLDITDYFPQEIVDNFDFEYVTEPTLGTISKDIDLQNNVIIWHIDELGYGESATVSYKLTLKDKIDEDIVGVVLSTNEKVDITSDNVVDDNGNAKVLTSNVTPKVKLTVEPEPEPEPEPDNTIIPEPLPQTGSTVTFYIVLAFAVIGAIALGIKFITTKKINY